MNKLEEVKYYKIFNIEVVSLPRALVHALLVYHVLHPLPLDLEELLLKQRLKNKSLLYPVKPIYVYFAVFVAHTEHWQLFIKLYNTYWRLCFFLLLLTLVRIVILLLSLLVIVNCADWLRR